MSTHPSTHHEIALLRHEERLVRAALAQARPAQADRVSRREIISDLEGLFEQVWARLGAQRGRAAARVSGQPS